MREDRARMVANLTTRHAAEMAALLEGGDGAAKREFKELATWVPECLPEEVMKAYEENGAKKGEVPPFFCEVTLYEMLGKGIARTLLGKIRSLGVALGFDSSRDLIDESEKESKGGVDQSAPMTHDDLDALEGLMRHDASYEFHMQGDEAANTIIRITRVLPILRTLVGAPNPHQDWLRIYPKHLKVGDRIIRNGRIITVHGFLDEDHKPCDGPKPWGEFLPNHKRPKDARKEPCKKHEARVMTYPNDEYGWRLESNEELIIQRDTAPPFAPDGDTAEEKTA